MRIHGIFNNLLNVLLVLTLLTSIYSTLLFLVDYIQGFSIKLTYSAVISLYFPWIVFLSLYLIKMSKDYYIKKLKECTEKLIVNFEEEYDKVSENDIFLN